MSRGARWIMDFLALKSMQPTTHGFEIDFRLSHSKPKDFGLILVSTKKFMKSTRSLGTHKCIFHMDHGFDLEYDHNPSGPLGMSRTLPEREFVRNSLTAIISAHSIIPSVTTGANSMLLPHFIQTTCP